MAIQWHFKNRFSHFRQDITWFCAWSPSFYCDKWRVPLGPLTTKRQGFPRYIVPTSYSLLTATCDWFKSPGHASLRGASSCDILELFYRTLFSTMFFVAVKTVLILLQSEQQITTALAFRPMTYYHFVTRFPVRYLHLRKAQSRCSENSMIMTQRSLGNPMPHLGTIPHRRVWNNLMGQIFTGALQLNHAKPTDD